MHGLAQASRRRKLQRVTTTSRNQFTIITKGNVWRIVPSSLAPIFALPRPRLAVDPPRSKSSSNVVGVILSCASLVFPMYVYKMLAVLHFPATQKLESH
ncbi:hypothetical protein SCHPADRAFT_905618 [Schizopora paradoxa]|uniref:Uncharacterized protein n=1 Tax=Schizopora paradoxa TaxID=27342 RepID=A0A0H2RIZ8_9AGAM|nr:hypothetical protein SCHPADRAFT_905618 [Schizopora paradoxa]